VAKQIGVNVTSIHNWEINVGQPSAEYLPKIIQFLGYNPLPEGKTWGERLVQRRMSLGLTQAGAALTMGVDPGTPARRAFWRLARRLTHFHFLASLVYFSDTPASSVTLLSCCRPVVRESLGSIFRDHAKSLSTAFAWHPRQLIVMSLWKNVSITVLAKALLTSAVGKVKAGLPAFAG
jgi:hypothetical protein